MTMHRLTKLLAAGVAFLCAGSALAHIVLQEGAAAPAASYRAVFRVGHGCEGQATTAIRVQIPDGFQGTKPMPKPGWNLRTRSDLLAKAYESHGKTITNDVVEVTWTANGPENALPEAWYDEFVLRGTTPQQPGPLWFKVLQSCEKGQTDWSEIPASGISTKGLNAPAALLQVREAPDAGHDH
jgi:uncharacterized protein YcnI